MVQLLVRCNGRLPPSQRAPTQRVRHLRFSVLNYIFLAVFTVEIVIKARWKWTAVSTCSRGVDERLHSHAVTIQQHNPLQPLHLGQPVVGCLVSQFTYKVYHLGLSQPCPSCVWSSACRPLRPVAGFQRGLFSRRRPCRQLNLPF